MEQKIVVLGLDRAGQLTFQNSRSFVQAAEEEIVISNNFFSEENLL